MGFLPSGGGGSSGSGAITQISATVLAAPGTFTLSAIPGTFNALWLLINARSADAVVNDNVALRLNGDSGGNYYRELVVLSASSALSAAEGLAQTSMGTGAIAGASGTAGFFGAVEILIPGYASTTWVKSVLWRGFGSGTVATGNQVFRIGGGTWNNTAAVTSINLTNANSNGNFVTGSQALLYGLT